MDFCQRIPRPGLLHAIFAAILLALGTVFAGKVVSNVQPAIPSALMYTALAFLAAPKMVTGTEWLTATAKQYTIAFVSGILSGGYIFFRLESMKYVTPVDTSALCQTQLIFVIILARIWLKEKIGIYEIFFMLLILIGSFLVTQPEFLFGTTSTNTHRLRYIGILMGLAAAMLSAAMSCMVRSLHTTSPYLVAFLQGVAASTTLLIYGSIGKNVIPTSSEWLWIALGSVGGALAVMCFTFAYKLEPASLVTAISSFETLVTVLMQIAFLNLIPNWITIFGIFGIIIGVGALTLKKQLLERLRCTRQIDR